MADKVAVAILHGSYEPFTVGAVASMVAYDHRNGGHLAHDHMFLQVPTTNIADGRNKAVRMFLDTDVDWLLFLDSDETWAPNLVEQLMDSADKDERPVVSGLVMAYRPEREAQGFAIAPACTIFDDSPDALPVAPPFIPNARWWEVATVGAGCLLIHRSVLEKVRTEFADSHPAAPWFEYQAFPYTDRDGSQKVEMMGEDYVFSARVHACGYKLVVDTTIELGHIKRVTFTRDMFHQQMARQGHRPTFVVIPVKDRLDLTEPLVEQLREQGGWDGLFIYDNGSGAATKEWLKAQRDLLVWDAKGAGIHQMWNAGIEQALRRSGGVCDVVFLNNDLKLGDRFVETLVGGLKGPWAAVSGNYDGRSEFSPLPDNKFPPGHVEQVQGICAERYDGTGGLAGFAFAVKGELFAQGYRFPNDCKWWFGDNDLTLTMDQNNLPYGVVIDATVEHLGAGTAKDWTDKKWQAQLAADQEAFSRKWSARGVRVA